MITKRPNFLDEKTYKIYIFIEKSGISYPMAGKSRAYTAYYLIDIHTSMKRKTARI